jgi:ankyrin repeat protein
MVAIARNNNEAVELFLLIRLRSIHSIKGRTALHLAADGLRTKVVAALLAVKPAVDVNGRDANGLTPLMLASDKKALCLMR